MARARNTSRIIPTLQLVSAAALCCSLGCKPLQEGNSGTLAEAVDNSRLPMHNLPLKNFGHELRDDYLAALGQRVDCPILKQIVAFPRQGTMKAGIAAVSASQYVYRDLEANFYDSKTVERYCNQGRLQTAATTGAAALAQVGQRKGGKVRLIITAGYRLQEQTKVLGDSVTAWTKASPGFEVSRVDCANPFLTVAECASDYEKKLETVAGNDLLLFWAHGKGGNIVLETLAGNKALRDKTIGIVTIGSPLGGAAAQTLVSKSIKATGKILAKFDLGIDPASFERDPLQILMTPVEQNVGAPVVGILKSQPSANVVQANTEMHPAERFKALQSLRGKDFSSARGDIPVFHVASLLDIASLNPMPPVSVSENGLVATKNARTWNHFLHVTAIPTFYDYPLSDGAVALEHAVIPPEYTPKGLKPQMLALFRLDHASLAFAKEYQAADGIPNTAIVDALLATVAAKLP